MTQLMTPPVDGMSAVPFLQLAMLLNWLKIKKLPHFAIQIFRRTEKKINNKQTLKC